MALSVFTSEPDGTAWMPLDAIGQVAGLTYTNASPGGDIDCSMTLALPVTANPRGLRLGRKLTVCDGPVTVWSGSLADPVRGNPWQITGQGLSSLAANYLALDATPAWTTNANTAVDQAILRGLPWTRPAAFPTPTVTASTPDLGALLDAVATASGQRWSVDNNGAVTMAADPTSPTLILTTVATPGGRTITDFATDLFALYQPPVGSPPVAGAPALVAAAGNPAPTAVRPFGHHEKVYNTTPGGPLSSTAAAVMAGGALTLSQASPSFSGAVAVTPGALCTLGGQPVRLSTVRAGQKVRMVGIQPDPVLGVLTFAVSVDVIIGTWAYNAVTDTATLTPLGATARNLTTLLQAAAPTATSTWNG